MTGVTKISRDDESPSPAAATALERDYDPFAEVFIAQKSRPTCLQDIDPGTLSPFERACLVIDGTVTRFLEAHKMEPIEVVNCGHTREVLKKDHEWLDLPKGEGVISRRVLLRGRYSERVYAAAASLIVPERLNDAVGRPVGGIEEGLGRILVNGHIEQYRELLWYGKEVSSNLPGEIRSLSSDDSLTRTYRIIVKNTPIILITEWFELHADPSG